MKSRRWRDGGNRDLSPFKFAPSLFVIALAACGQQAETQEQYAKNPVGCDTKTAQWYVEAGSTKSGQLMLCDRAKSLDLRAKYHGIQIEFDSLSRDEKADQANKAITCLRESKWSYETLAKAGITNCTHQK